MEFMCDHCYSKDIYIQNMGTETGLYCSECGRWIQWLNKEEFDLAQKQIKGQKFTVNVSIKDKVASNIGFNIHSEAVKNMTESEKRAYYLGVRMTLRSIQNHIDESFSRIADCESSVRSTVDKEVN